MPPDYNGDGMKLIPRNKENKYCEPARMLFCFGKQINARDWGFVVIVVVVLFFCQQFIQRSCTVGISLVNSI